MPRVFYFTDESGDLNFKNSVQSSKYFIICTVRMESCRIGNDLLELRRELLFKNAPILEEFHATEDKQFVRDQVFKLIATANLTVQATLLEKRKAQDHVRKSGANFYKHGWFYHLKYAPIQLPSNYEALFTTAKIGTKKSQAVFTAAVNDVLQQTHARRNWSTHFCPSATDPCLQIADYSAWAIQRKWERGDPRSYDLIKHLINYEFDLWKMGKFFYY